MTTASVLQPLHKALSLETDVYIHLERPGDVCIPKGHDN